MKEIWRPIVDYEGLYEASSLGRIKSLKRVIVASNGIKKPIQEKILKAHPTKSGYFNTVLNKNGKAHPYRLHRVILKAFTNKSNYNKEVNHKDGVKANNCIDNLEWVTPSENVIHSYKFLNKGQLQHRYYLLHNGLDKKLLTTKGASDFLNKGWGPFYTRIKNNEPINGYRATYLGKLSIHEVENIKEQINQNAKEAKHNL